MNTFTLNNEPHNTTYTTGIHIQPQVAVSRFHVLVIGTKYSIPDHTNGMITQRVKDYIEAKQFLNTVVDQGLSIPDVILSANHPDESKSGNSFLQYLKTRSSLNALPFILVENPPESNNFKTKWPIPGIDDIINKDITIEQLIKKTTTLKKIKSLKKSLKVTTSKLPIIDERIIIYKIDSFFKRLLDILISSLALSILSPLMLLITIIIKLDSRGPAFYTSYRAGSNYKIFKFFKFRTMRVDADTHLAALQLQNQYSASDASTPVFFKISNDPRITRFGKLLRNTSLDEIPQLLNVLMGDMSLVGNRPLPLYEAKALTTDRHAERFNAPAGITGLWQITKRGQHDMSIDERINLDIAYAKRNSFLGDLKIMLKTPKALIQKDNV